MAERAEIVGALSQFTASDYVMALPMTLLTVFALGILLIDLMLPAEEKWVNALLAFVGVLFAGSGVWKIQHWMQTTPSISKGTTGMMGTMLMNPCAVYFFYLFLAATAISILMSVRYMKTEHENHGEYYALMLLSVVGMMCMTAGLDIV
ncbi:MAG: hypothetical protein WAL56_17925, partial [Candidatus Sulfotelmatobacter sp.]